MADTTITSANSVLTLTVAGLFPVAQQMQGYSTDKAWMTDAIDVAETSMGVDGRMTSGYVFNPTKMTLTFQADSPSVAFFAAVISAMKAVREVFYFSGELALPGPGEKYTLTRGVLTNIKQIPDGQKLLQPVDYVFTFERIDRALL